MNNLKVVFMGTPTFAVPILEGLIKNTKVLLVVSQPDREKDRKGNILPTPTKKLAIENNIEVYQPIKVKEEYQYIIDKNPDNRKAKRREAVMQMGNISIPILTVDLTNRLCNKLKVSEKTNILILLFTV